MPNVSVTPPQQVVARARAERLTGRLLRSLHEFCDDVVHYRGLAKVAADQRQLLAQLHPELVGADVRTVARHCVVLVAPFAIWIVDVFLLSSVSEYLATLMFPEHPQAILAARFLVALSVVSAELALSALLHAAHEHAEETEHSGLLAV